MGIAVSLILIAVGAILTWAVNADPEGLDLNVVGVILMIVGLVSIVLTLLFWSSWWGPGYWTRGRYVEGEAPARRRYGGRRTYVEEEAPRARETYVEEDVPPGPPP
jgi:hypothetical protein